MTGQLTAFKKPALLSTGPLDPSEARWIGLVKRTYTDPNGVTRTWEAAERLTRSDSAIDGVGIVTILSKPSGPELLLQKQYRPPIDMVTIEIPAGLVDAGETAEECAVRELREETGYVGVVQQKGPILYNGFLGGNIENRPLTEKSNSDPGFCNTNMNMVHVRVDMSLPENQNPKPKLEDDEFIESFSIPLAKLFEETKRLEREEGYAIDAHVGTLAEGIEMARQWGIVG
ncbi:ADP-ribose pyrophosphatase [Trichophyton violaceum]|uniref:ADP-ribose pyrophosphatase n=1 Tax=Trichophyton violaceum TaxID=34388 RepID=A0A178FD36_TRIVO|nr:ADP-ribose pyrophosphatase [Trichophyton violaceum]